MQKATRILFPLLGLLFLSCNAAQTTTTKLQPPPTGKVYFGAFPDFGGSEDTVTTQRIKDFETLTGKGLVWAAFSQNWFGGITYPKTHIHTIHDAGAIPYVRLMPRSDESQGHAEPRFTMQRIINGDFDANLTKWAQDAKADGIPLLIDFAVEMNGDWFPWSGVFNGGSTTTGYGDASYPDGPERYRDAYRHIIELFRAEGVTHVTWMFHINLTPFPDAAWNQAANYYPGDDYIDWIGFSAYGAQTLDEEWEGLEFSTQLKEHCGSFTAISASKPRAVFEFGVVDGHKDGNKSVWLDDAFGTILDNTCTTFQAINPWHEDWQNEDETRTRIRLDSSPEVTATVRRWLSDPRFISEPTFSGK
jgi:hypothetical protein